MQPTSNSKFKNQNGQTMLLTVLVLSGTLLSLALAAGLLMLFQLRQAGDFTNSAKALFAADSGVEWWYYTSKGLNPAVPTSSVNFTNGQTFEVINAGGGYAKIIGQAGNSKRAFLVKPQPQAVCQPDLMLVVDRSGSIETFESDYEPALRNFVDDFSSFTKDLGRIGLVSFGNSGSLNQHLTETSSSVRTSITALNYSGGANLQSGINLARRELGDDPTLPGHFGAPPFHDRDDNTNPDLILVITDSFPNRPPPPPPPENLAETEANLARTSGARIFVVGINPSSNAAFNTYFITRIIDDVNYPDDYKSVDDYGAGLAGALFTILAEGICPPN